MHLNKKKKAHLLQPASSSLNSYPQKYPIYHRFTTSYSRLCPVFILHFNAIIAYALNTPPNSAVAKPDAAIVVKTII